MTALVEMKLVFIMLSCVTLAMSHMCMLSPTQRGSLVGINKPAAADCMLTTKQCGGRKPGPAIALKAGQNFTVTFQKNLNHWVQASPGHFSVMWGTEGSMLNELIMIPDKNETSLTIYSVNVTIPSGGKSGHSFIIQTQYVTMNPNAPPVFYQCGDVVLL